MDVNRYDKNEIQDIPILIAIFTYLGFAMLYIMGHLRDFFISFNLIQEKGPVDVKTKNFVPLIMDFESFYTRNLYFRMIDCWNRPIVTNAGAKIAIMERTRDSMFDPLRINGRTIDAINMGSYNYLGFGDPLDLCSLYVNKMLLKHGISSCSTYRELGYSKIIRKLERTVASFVGKEDSICFPIGFATNSNNIQALVDDKCCIISDELNHASLILGSRLSNCKIFVYKHNDMTDLEAILRDVIIQGRGKGHRDWKKIILIVEGIYSMEGTYVNLPAILKLKEKYKFYLYLDEAHSIGCTGRTGRGIAEYFNIDPKNIDIMMGTFTKSFGSCGGYIAASKKIIDHIRRYSFSTAYGTTMSPAACAQVIASMRIISGQIGKNIGRDKLRRLKENIVYFRSRLKNLGFIIYGNDSSPIVPLLLYAPGKICEFSRQMLDRGVAVVVVGFPATPILLSRARFCISSNHTKEMLDYTIESIDNVGSRIGLKYNHSLIG